MMPIASDILRTIGNIAPKAKGVVPTQQFGVWNLPLPSGGSIHLRIQKEGGVPFAEKADSVDYTIRSNRNYYRRINHSYPVSQKAADVHGTLRSAKDEGGAASGHPDVSWGLNPDVWKLVRDDPKAARRVGKEAITEVAKFLKVHANKYSPSAYVFFPTSDSRNRLYKGMAERVGGKKYKYQEEKSKDDDMYPRRMLVQSGDIKNDILGGLAATVPLGLLAAAGTEQGQDFLREAADDVPRVANSFFTPRDR